MHAEIYPAVVTTRHRDPIDLVVAAKHQEIANIVWRLDSLFAHLVGEAIRIENMQGVEHLVGIKRRPQAPLMQMVDFARIARSTNPARKVKLLHENPLVLAKFSRFSAFFVAREFHHLVERMGLLMNVGDGHAALQKSKSPARGGAVGEKKPTEVGNRGG